MSKTRDEIVADIVASMLNENTADRLKDLVGFTLAVSAAMVDVGAPENVPIPEFIRKEIRPDPVVVERIVTQIEKLIKAGGGARSTWATVIEAAIMDETPAIELKTPPSRIILPPGKRRLH